MIQHRLRRSIIQSHRQRLNILSTTATATPTATPTAALKKHYHYHAASSLLNLPLPVTLSMPIAVHVLDSDDDRNKNVSHRKCNGRFITTATSTTAFDTSRSRSHSRTSSSATSIDNSNKMHYHTTTKKEIIPLIAVGSLAVLGTYSYKALQRMDAEWEEYEEALEEYKLEHGLSDDDIETIMNDNDNSSSKSTSSRATGSVFEQGKMAIDLGSMNIRIAHQNKTNKSSKSNSIKPKIIINREGGRSTPNSIIIETDGSLVSGQMAASKIYERSQSNNPVLNPYSLLSKAAASGIDGVSSGSGSNDDNMTANYAVENVIASLAKNALEQALGGSKSDDKNSHSSSSKILFSLDSSIGYNTQPIFTYPPQNSNNNDKTTTDNKHYLQIYQDSINDIISPTSIAKFVPEPLCAVKGAKYAELIQPSSSSIMIIDVGGKTTSISIVNDTDTENQIKYHTTLQNFGGETIIETVMNYISKSFYDTSIDNVDDKIGLQRLYDASKSAVIEIGGSKHGRVDINIPYLSVDEKMRPRHLDLGLSSIVLQAEFDDMVKSSIIPNASGGGIDNQNVLSQSMIDSGVQPDDLESFLFSMIMNVFEKSGQNPFTLDSVLIIGGGARSPMFQRGFKAALGKLAGEQFVQDKVVLPKDVLMEEMVVLGAVLSSDD